MDDNVNLPKHYRWLNGLEAIDVCEQLGFNLGNVVKYVIRSAGPDFARKHPTNITEDLRKAAWYLQREITRREKADKDQAHA